MARYRLEYRKDGARAHVHEFTASSDSEAIRLSEDVAGPMEMELWCGDRMVKAFERR